MATVVGQVVKLRRIPTGRGKRLLLLDLQKKDTQHWQVVLLMLVWQVEHWHHPLGKSADTKRPHRRRPACYRCVNGPKVYYGRSDNTRSASTNL
jgi:hypothetical protein